MHHLHSSIHLPYTTLFRSEIRKSEIHPTDQAGEALIAMLKDAAKLSNENRDRLMDLTHDLSRQLQAMQDRIDQLQDRKSTRLNSSHGSTPYAVLRLKKKHV